MEPNNEEHNEEFFDPQEIENLDELDDSQVEEPLYDIQDIDNLDNDYPEKTNSFKEAYDRAKNERGVYDKNYYANRKEELDNKVASAEEKKNQKQKEVLKKNENGEKVPTQKNKNIFDKTKDNLDVMKAKNDRFQNKLNDARAKAYNITHPQEALKDRAKAAVKDKAKDVAKNTGKKAAQGAAKAGKAAGKAIGAGAKVLGKAIVSLAANPYFWIVVGIAALILLIILLFMGISQDGETGYYDPVCDFNATTVNIYVTENNTTTTEEGTEETTSTKTLESSVNLEEFVMGTTYSLIGNNEYSDDTIKAIYIILKTNVLSLGYDNTTKSIDINKEDTTYVETSTIDEERLEELQELYDEVAEELFISEEYEAAITTLSSENSLGAFDINKIEELSNSYDYEGILDELYNDGTSEYEKIIYELGEYCTFYELTENDAYWWPIGSSSPSEGNIYGGAPTTLTVTSPFGPRVDPVTGEIGTQHNGIDIGADDNEKVIATKAGVVTTAANNCKNNEPSDCNGKAGNMVVIDHGNGIVSRYLHLYPDSIVVNVGDTVVQGQLIGEVGNTGKSTGSHLHFEIKINGVAVNPLEYISAENPRPVTKFDLEAVDENAQTKDEVQKAICVALLNTGYSDNAVAGILANITSEGKFKTNNLEDCYETNVCCPNVAPDYGFCNKGYDPDIYANDISYTKAVDNGLLSREEFANDRAGYGIVQWTSSGRKEGLYDFAKQKGKSISSLELQIGYMLKEINESSSYAISKKYITGNFPAEEVAKYICINYETPKNYAVKCPLRASKNAPTMLTYVQNGCS